MMYPPPTSSPGRPPHNLQQWEHHPASINCSVPPNSTSSERPYLAESHRHPEQLVATQRPTEPQQYHPIHRDTRRNSSPIPVHKHPYQSSYLQQHERRYRYSYPPYYPDHQTPPPPPHLLSQHQPPFESWISTNAQGGQHWVQGTYHHPQQQHVITSNSATSATISAIAPTGSVTVVPASVSSMPSPSTDSTQDVSVDRMQLNDTLQRRQQSSSGEYSHYEETAENDFVIVQPSFDDYDATNRTPNSPSPVKGGVVCQRQYGNNNHQYDNLQSRSPQQERTEANGVDNDDERSPSSPPLKNDTPTDRKRVRNLPEHLIDPSANVEETEPDKDEFKAMVSQTEAFADDDESSLSGGHKHRRLFSEDSMNIGHHRIDSLASPTISSSRPYPQNHQQKQQQHHRVDSAGLDILSAVADATKAELAAAAGNLQHSHHQLIEQQQLVEQIPRQHGKHDQPWEVVVEQVSIPQQHLVQPQQPHSGYHHPLEVHPLSRPPTVPVPYPPTHGGGHNDNPHMHPPNRRVGTGTVPSRTMMPGVGPVYDRHPYGPPVHSQRFYPSNHHQYPPPYDHHQPGPYPPAYYPTGHHQHQSRLPPPPYHHHHYPPAPHQSMLPHPSASYPSQRNLAAHPLPALPSTSQSSYPQYPSNGKMPTTVLYPTDDRRPEEPVSDLKARLENPPPVPAVDESWSAHASDTGTLNAAEVNTGISSTNQGSQTFVTAIAVGNGEKILTSSANLKNAATNTDDNFVTNNCTGAVPSEVRGFHHRKLSSFSSVGLGTIFGSSLLSPGAVDTPPLIGQQQQHPLKTPSLAPPVPEENSAHHRSASSVSFLNVLDSVVCHDNDMFLRNLQESVPGYRSPVASVKDGSGNPSPDHGGGNESDYSSDKDNNDNRSRSKVSSTLAEGGTSKRIRRKCTVANCINRVVQGGLCIAHGAKRKMCNHPGCKKHVKKAGLCSSHGPARKRCATTGCQKVAVQGGRCIAHGAKKKLCSVLDCNKQAILCGMCKKHHDLHKSKGGTFTEYNVDEPTTAGFDYCQEVASAVPSPPASRNPRRKVGSEAAISTAVKKQQHKPTHTRGLSIFHDISAATVSSLLNEDTSLVPSTLSGNSGSITSHHPLGVTSQQHERGRVDESTRSMW